MFYIKKLNLVEDVKAALFAGVRLLNANVLQQAPEFVNKVIWNARRGEHFYEASAARFSNEAPPVKVDGTEILDAYFDRFKLDRFLATFYDTNWGYHKHAQNYRQRYNLAIIDSSFTSVARFWKTSDPSLNVDPSRDFDYAYLPPNFPDMELMHEEVIEPFEVYMVSAWQWHSHFTPGTEDHSYLDGVVPGEVRVLTHLVIPRLGRNDQDALNYIEWIENLR